MRLKDTFLLRAVRIVLLLYASAVFLLALFSGAGPGVAGVLYNIPNTLPWIILLVITWLSWKDPVKGGVMSVLYAVLLVYFFEMRIALTSEFLVFISPMIVLGLLLIIAGSLSKKSS